MFALPGPRAPPPQRCGFLHPGNGTILVATLVAWLRVDLEASLVCSPLLWAQGSGQDPAKWDGEQARSLLPPQRSPPQQGVSSLPALKAAPLL